MSFDLYAVEHDGELTPEAVVSILESGEESPKDWSPSPQMSALLTELADRWPGLDDDPDNSPWSSWPLWQPEADGVCAFNIAFSRAEEVVPVMLEACRRHGLALFNPQTGEVTNPRTASRRTWNPFRRS